MKKELVINSVIEELKEECNTKFRADVRDCLISINSISEKIKKLKDALDDKRKELASMEFIPYDVEL